MIEYSDEDLVKLSLDGEKSAWDALLTRYERLIFHTALKTGIEPDEVEDVFQSVCMIWIQNLKSLRQPQQLGAWLVTITRREVWSRWKHDHDSKMDAEDVLELQIDPKESPEQLAAQTQDAHAVNKALSQIGEPCRSLLKSLYFDPKHPSYADISHRLNIAANSIGPTRSRCLEKLKQILSKNGW